MTTLSVPDQPSTTTPRRSTRQPRQRPPARPGPRRKGRSRRPWLRKVAGVFGLAVGLSVMPAGPASATAVGESFVASGHAINVEGQTVSVPKGIFVFGVIGDDLWVDQFFGSFTSPGVRSWRMDVSVINTHGETTHYHHGEDHVTPEARGFVEDAVWWDGHLPSDTSLVCGHLYVRDAPVATHCHHVYSGWRLF